MQHIVESKEGTQMSETLTTEDKGMRAVCLKIKNSKGLCSVPAMYGIKYKRNQ